ncbi:hypothetical protein SCHPADRAFT_620199 [Schizopora paradoxa]|uniref:Uncharacterized protein n=1 Tax=Schizopora paradoxa TaxID=27342 RepID=A0A0H2R9V1_9AGAM|nr:hypothetical protein SCHPADRAFT_620199 [Schizopora paradoxa]
MAKPEETGSEIILLSIADKDKLCKFSKDVEEYLGVKLVQSLLCLNGFRVPQASAILCAKLAAWREQVELICSRQSAMANRHLMLPKIPRAGGELKTKQNGIVANELVGSALTPEPERTDWKPFISSCEELVRGLRQFSVALEHLGKYYNLHTTEIVNRMGAFIVTLKVSPSE